LNEKLASDLAALCGISVPKNEFDKVEGQGDTRFAVSHAHGVESIDIPELRRRSPDDFNSAPVQAALKKASGSLAFWAWTATQDLKDEHLCLATDTDGAYHIAGVDFQSSFHWQEADGGQVQSPAVPPSMQPNIDKAAVEAAVSAIEHLSDEQIRSAVNALPDALASPEEKKRRIDGLIGRRPKVRERMKQSGWLD
jgi:hypothetical protein